MLTTAVGIGIAYATIKVKIATIEKNNDRCISKEQSLQLHKESKEEQKQLLERITQNQALCVDMQKELMTLKENHTTRIVRLEEAMNYIKRSIDSIDKKLDRILAR